MLPWLLYFVFLNPQEVPYKPAAEFDIAVDVQIKPRPNAREDDNTQFVSGHVERTTKEQVPHLTIHLKFLTLSPDETKVKVSRLSGKTLYNKKAVVGTLIDIPLGFVPDIKQGTSDREWEVILSSGAKHAVSRIRIRIEEDGSFFVNDVASGKF